MKAYALASTLLLMLPACSPVTSPAPDLQQARALQKDVGGSATSEWGLETTPWSSSLAAMRDRAYVFCMQKHPGNEDCLHWQDISLIAASHAEGFAAMAVKGDGSSNPFEQAIHDRPAAYANARKFCFAVYEDAGAQDARILGPCFATTMGGDFFSLVPVP